jgi:hypothetical protein
VDRIEPIAPDRSVPRIDLTYLTPLEREREKERREQRRRRDRPAEQAPEKGSGEPNSRLDVRV